ncbi:MAG: hypothetical protein HW383_15 [Candidatus Magasanikbacteria bacterium]|nr:hypothetical protein [Candidatus Magasanikbacteria bacterium]
MADRIFKILRRLSSKEQKQLTDVIRLIQDNDLIGHDLKKLKGRDDVYRLRKGDFRIIFRRMPNSENIIIAVERRSDNTYRF